MLATQKILRKCHNSLNSYQETAVRIKRRRKKNLLSSLIEIHCIHSQLQQQKIVFIIRKSSSVRVFLFPLFRIESVRLPAFASVSYLFFRVQLGPVFSSFSFATVCVHFFGWLQRQHALDGIPSKVFSIGANRFQSNAHKKIASLSPIAQRIAQIAAKKFLNTN